MWRRGIVSTPEYGLVEKRKSSARAGSRSSPHASFAFRPASNRFLHPKLSSISVKQVESVCHTNWPFAFAHLIVVVLELIGDCNVSALVDFPNLLKMLILGHTFPHKSELSELHHAVPGTISSVESRVNYCH